MNTVIGYLGEIMANTKKTLKADNNASQDAKTIINRLSRINGQINGVKKMLEEGRDCGDVLIQMMAISSSIKSTQRSIFEHYFQKEYIENIHNEKTLEEIFELLKRI